MIPRSPTHASRDAALAMKRMHCYTTLSMVAVVAVFAVISAGQLHSGGLVVAAIGAGLALAGLGLYWDRPAPWWLSILAVGSTSVLWWVTLAMGDYPLTVLMLSTALGVIVAQQRVVRPVWILASALWVVAPVAVLAILVPGTPWYSLVVTALLAVIAAMGAFLLNRYGWARYLEMDAARRTGAELAVAQERHRFAADLHDIQGHTLHVLKLKTQLADKLIDSDPVAAHAHLAEAQVLINETLANTRTLAFGSRHIAVASELANARELFEAAGIRYRVEGEFAPGPFEELLGLAVRETTTNVLRHAQATTVTVRLGDGRVSILNNGSPGRPRSLSGLARLGERFEAAGGRLTTRIAGDIFTTEASVAAGAGASRV